MRRIKKVKPLEVSLCNAAANRRVFGLYKSRNKPEEAQLEDVSKGGPGSGPQAGGSAAAAKKASKEAHEKNTVTAHEAASEAHFLAAQRYEAKGDHGDQKGMDRHIAAAKEHLKAAENAPDAGKNPSEKADKRTGQAEASGSSSDHRQAASDHDHAAMVARIAGDKKATAEHTRMASYHNSESSNAKRMGKTATQGSAMNIQDAISNTDPKILKALGAVAKSVAAEDGRSYTPQAASIIKAVGRLLAPFAEELTLSDLQAVGKAAGLGAKAGGGEESEMAPAFKSKAKPSADDDELEDDADTQGPEGDDVPDDEEVEEETEEPEEEDEEEEDEKTTKSASTIAADGDLAQGISKAKPSFLNKDDEDEDEEDDEDDGEEESGGGSKKAPPFGQPKGAKAKGDKVAKAAHAGQSMDARYEEIMAKHRQLADENKQLREVFAKTRTDLDAERDFRQTEAIKKSIREDYGHLGLEEEKILPVLKRAKDADDQAAYEALTAVLKSANDRVKGAQAASGIFEAVGKSSAGSQTGASWSDRIEAKVDELMTKSAKAEHRAVVYDRFIQTPEGREMRKNHRAEKGRI